MHASHGPARSCAAWRVEEEHAMGANTKSDKKATKKSRAAAVEPPAKAKKKGKGAGDPAAIIAAARAAAFTDQAPARAFAHFKPRAVEVPTAGLPVFTGQPLLMRANILTALDVIEPYLPAAVAALREPRLEEIFELPSLVMGLDFAVGRVPVAKLSARDIEKMLAEGAPWRELMLSYLEVASHPLIGLLPRERVAAVRAGQGKLDQAQDFVTLPGLFAEFEGVLAGKHPFPADRLDLLATLGGALVQQVRPGKAIAEVQKRSGESILRDQFAALVTARYDRLQVLAAVAVGKRRADELLPALRAAIGLGRPAEAGVEATEAPPPTVADA